MSNKIAVIDLGTNTFHLLIVEVIGPDEWMMLERERVFVNLASDGIDLISDAAMERGITTMRHFRERIAQFTVDSVVAVGTAALRRAQNARDFIQKVHHETGLRVEVISGKREAELISKGVLLALPETGRPMLIMDIGGGSVEMILVRDGAVLYADSYAIGVAILHARFHREEPIQLLSLEQIDRYLDNVLKPLLEQLVNYPNTALVGASGTFEVVEAILEPNTSESEIPTFATAKPALFEPIYKEIIALNYEQRLAHPGIPNSRARYIVVAVHLIDYILRKVSDDIFFISNYAMKEGIVAEYSDKQYPKSPA